MTKITTADIAKAGRTTLRGVHIWDRRGLLGDVQRDQHGARVFGPEHLRKARLIAAGQMAGMTLAEIKGGVSPMELENASTFLREVCEEIRAGYDL